VTNFLPAAPYDIIVSNPPFYQDDLKATAQKRNWAFHNETLSLAQLFSFIAENLHSRGYFFLLVPARRENEVEKLIRQTELTLVEKIKVRTAAQHPAHRLLLAGQRKKTEEIQTAKHIDEKEICITNAEGTYSNEFTELLKDYYLAL
jgi:tRNA1Val (adenine37-N6)-methyltransferase